MSDSPKITKKAVEWHYFCECNHQVYIFDNYCSYCGRRLKWADENIIDEDRKEKEVEQNE